MKNLKIQTIKKPAMGGSGAIRNVKVIFLMIFKKLNVRIVHIKIYKVNDNFITWQYGNSVFQSMMFTTSFNIL